MDKLARNAGEFRASGRRTLLPWGGEKIGMAICYEVVFPAEVAELVRDGATMLVTITNDAWYGDTSAPWQHFRTARFRAAENRRPLLRAAITGVSAYVAPDGSVRAQIGVFREGVIARPGARGEGPDAVRPPAVAGAGPVLADRQHRAGLDLAVYFAAKEPTTMIAYETQQKIDTPDRTAHQPPGVSLRAPTSSASCPRSTTRCRRPASGITLPGTPTILQKRREIEKRLETLNQLRSDSDELATWRELLDEGEADPEFDRFIERLQGELGQLELQLKLSGPDDDKNAILAIHPGAGGTESQDWAEMLLRMYLRWAEQHGYAVEMHRPPGRRRGGHQERHLRRPRRPTPTAT